ncbi:amidohydrolase family protein [Arthrobacter sp. FW306-2-2C-D06B]|uniref:amidohydrolase family protein n=1 Tax=Arthrobacter sp. FW306-2-2C-D06B TaxID=2879618 RepID=UPI001F2F078E|nr:amidohydrolase family protein [Arthrobacter sp. FW306-2-2C-D06B]UKA59501.1 amidohydrolase family protein [Arthrobacter sp. FW306-2-2C-D06B]
MSTLIHGGTVVPGTGNTVVESGAVILRHGRVSDVLERWDREHAFDGEVIDASGCVVMPGLINSHVHGVTPGPLMPSGAPALPDAEWLANLDRHLLAGTTTVLNLCGFCTMDHVREADRRHAVHVRGATTHLPEAERAARLADGRGLPAQSGHSTVEKMLNDGAIAIGELGGGQTLGGGGQDLSYIPRAIERASGVCVHSVQARRMKEAVLGRFIDPDACDMAELRAAAAEAGLEGRIDLVELRNIIADSVLPSIEPALNGIREGVQAAARFGVPAILHSAAATARVMRGLMDGTPLITTGASTARVIASHANHPSHTPAEALALARLGRDHGWSAEVSVFDLLHRKQTVTTREHWDVLLQEPGLVEVLATDYGHEGHHDELISAVQDVAEHGYRSLAGAVAMATSAVTGLIPGIAPNGGRIEAGRDADVVVASAEDFRNVRFVFVGGVCVVRDGRLTPAARR